MSSLRVFNPSGATEITSVHAPRLKALDGGRIAFLSNDTWQAHRTLPLVQELLQGRSPTARILTHQEFPQGNAQIDNDDTVRMVVAKGAQAAVIGNAA
jgi:hypothetical protein